MIRKYRKPHRIKRKKLIFKNRFFWLTLLILIIIGGLFYFLFFSSTFQIREIQVSGNQKILVGDLQNLIQNQIEQKLLFFSTRSIFLANLNKIKAELLEKFPQITQANLNRRLPNILLVQIEERKPVAIFCHTQLAGEGPNCFFLDKEGIIFDLVRNDIANGLIIWNLTLKENLILGKKAVEKEKLSLIFEIESKLKNDLKISLREIAILSEERLNAKTSEGWEIYFDPKGDLNWQLTKLSLVLEEKIPPEKRGKLEYIDLRFSRVYYKYR